MKTLNKIFWILLFSLASSPLFGQTPIDTFVQKVNGADDLTAAVQAADGGYVTTSRIDNTSFVVRKIKASGHKQWERRLNFLDPIDNFAFINGIAQTTDGGFVLLGRSGFNFSFDGVNEATLVKLRPNGTVAWQKSFAVSKQNFSRYSSSFSSVIATSDGGFIAVGAIATDERVLGPPLESLVVRFAATGDVVWGKSFKLLAAAADYSFRPVALITSTPTPDNGFIVAFPTTRDVYNLPVGLNGVDVMKITNSGSVVWEKSLKTGPAFVFQATGSTADGGVILIGTGKNSNKLKVLVLKPNGRIRWKAEYSLKVPGSIISVSSPIQTRDGGYVLTGSGHPKSGKNSYGFIAKIDSSRKVAFQNTFDGQVAGTVFTTADGGSLLFGSGVGSTSSDLLVLKVNSEGIVAGCDFLQSLGVTTPTAFGSLRIRKLKITKSDDLSLEPINIGLTSVVSNNPVSTVCH
jgi:hypothetical protein